MYRDYLDTEKTAAEIYPQPVTVPQGETPFREEYEEYIRSYPGRGTLKVQISVARGAFPLKNVLVDVSQIYNGVRYSLYHDVTDSSGIVNEIVLPSCAAADNNSPETAGKNDVTYLVSVYHPAFKEVVDFPVTVQDRVETILPVALEPLSNGTEARHGCYSRHSADHHRAFGQTEHACA